MAAPVKPFVDEVLAQLVDIGGVTDVFIMRRKNEGKPIPLYARWWDVGQTRECDGKRLIELRARPAVDRQGEPRPLMCSECGGLKLKQQGLVWSCMECGSFEVVP